MKSLLLFAFVCSLFGADYSDQMIADSLKKLAYKHNIDKKVLYTIAKIESGFTPLIICFTSKSKDHKYLNLRKIVGKYKDKYLITFTGAELDLKIALKDLIQKGYKVDVGLMQINSINFSNSEIDRIFNIEYNISKSIAVLKMCMKLGDDTKQIIECYNKGKRDKYARYDYYEKFKNSFLLSFARL